MKRAYSPEEACRVNALLLCNVEPREIAQRIGRSHHSLICWLSEHGVSVFRFRQRYRREVLEAGR